jgi:hypothetical protein
MHDRINHRLSAFSLHTELRSHVQAVMVELPPVVLVDLLDDPAFTLSDYDPGAGRVFHVPVGLPVRGRPGRSVVLKRTVLRRPEAFVRWVIAHELAHAHLRNAGRFPGEDPEHAADALASEWGFPKPASTPAPTLAATPPPPEWSP